MQGTARADAVGLTATAIGATWMVLVAVSVDVHGVAVAVLVPTAIGQGPGVVGQEICLLLGAVTEHSLAV